MRPDVVVADLVEGVREGVGVGGGFWFLENSCRVLTLFSVGGGKGGARWRVEGGRWDLQRHEQLCMASPNNLRLRTTIFFRWTFSTQA